MSAKKNTPVEMKVARLGIVRDLNFSKDCIADVALNQTDYGRILDVLRQYVAEDFPDDEAYNDALKTVCSKLKRKAHRLIMVEEVFVGGGKVMLDHSTGKSSSVKE